MDFARASDLPREVAAMIAEGDVIGWVEGRAEFGPRALGHRSILADPRDVNTTARINAMIKKREAFRPFAPAILEESLADVLERPGASADLSYMTFVMKVLKPHARAWPR